MIRRIERLYSWLALGVITSLVAASPSLTAQHNGIEPALEFTNVGDQIVLPAVTVPAGSDFEFSVWLFPRSWEGNNPGLWRAVGNGNFFNIFQGATGRPWIRWGAGNNILQPADGYSVPLNEWTQVRYVITSGESAQFFTRSPGEENWTLRHSAAHAVVTEQFTFTTYGWQSSTTERVVGIHNRIEFRINGDPIIQWDLNEGLGAVVAGDSSGNENDGQIQGPRWVDTTGANLRVPSQAPFDLNFGSVRYVNIRDDLGLGRFDVGVAAIGGLPFTDSTISITSLPSELAGKVALRTANSEGSWLFDSEATPITDIQWTYTDAVPDLNIDGDPMTGANTTLADGSGPFQPIAGTAGGEDEWGLRAFSNNGTILQSFGGGPNGPENTPELKTTIRDLEPGRVYPVTAMFWRDGTPWTIRAGLQYGNDLRENELFDMNHSAVYETPAFDWTNSVLTTEGNRVMLAAFLGNAVADENGEIDVFVHDVPTNQGVQRTWYDGVAVGSTPFIRSGNYLAFEVDRDTTVYVINHPSAEPAWLTSSFSATGMTVETTAGTFDVWQRPAAARELIVLPGNGGDVLDLNYWVVLGDGPDAITESPENRFDASPADDWSVGSYFWRSTTDPEAALHTASLLTEVSNFNPETGFRLTSTIRVPRLQSEGNNSIGLLLLAEEDGNAAIRAEWLPRASGGGSVLRFVNTSNGSILAQKAWTGLVPTRTDNDVGASAGAVEVLYSAGSPIFVEDAEIVVFTEDFETGANGWTTGADDHNTGTEVLPAVDQWEIGIPTSGPGSAFSGANVAATILNGPYETGEAGSELNVTFIAWLRSPVIDLSGAAEATLRFQEFMMLDDFTDGANLHHRGTIKALDANSLEELAQVAVYKEEIAVWSERVVDLSGVAGNQIILEFALVTDEFDENLPDGWYIDAVEVTARGTRIESMPENLALDGTLYGIPTERAGVDDATLNHLQFTVSDRGVSGNDGVTVYVAWDVRASGLEPDWLTQAFDRTDHFVGVNSDAGFHRLWAREYADGAQVTLGGASAAGPGAAGLPFGTDNYFVLLGDARPGLETFFTLEATGAWTAGEGTLTFRLTDSNGFSETVETMVSGDVTNRNSFGLVIRHPEGAPDTVFVSQIWEVNSLAMESLEMPDLLTFEQWRDSIFEPGDISAGLADPEATPAGDGVANIIKYALDLAPFEPAPRADLPRLEPNQDHILILVYRERTDIDRSQIEYRPEVSDDLDGDGWQSGPGSITELNRQSISSNLEEVTVRGELPVGAGKGFIRLNVIKHN